MDLSAIKPVSSGSMNIADAIAKAQRIAADHGISHSGMRADAVHVLRFSLWLTSHSDSTTTRSAPSGKTLAIALSATQFLQC